MKKIALIFITFLLMVQWGVAQNLQAHLAYATFYAPEEKTPYIETYLSINPKSILFKKGEDGTFSGQVEVNLIFKKDSLVMAFDKYTLNSPKLSDTTNINTSFLDQRRFALPNGDYEFTIIISDKYSEKLPSVFIDKLSINYDENTASISDFQMIDSYKKTETPNLLTKGGYDFTPYPANYYPDNKDEIIFWTEIYNTDKLLGENEPMLIKSYIESDYDNDIANQYIKVKKAETTSLLPLIQKFNIDSLPSGNYHLGVDVISKKNQVVIQKKYFFQRSNTKIESTKNNLAELKAGKNFAREVSSKDSLIYYVKTLRPIATRTEKIFIENNNLHEYDAGSLRQFLYAFWTARDKFYPKKAWEEYKQKVIIANESFSMLNKKGYATDRGSVFLRFGAPNTVVKEYFNNAAYPHEIWHYYNIKGRYRDVKFVFYTHDMVVSDFELIHSNLPGEIKNKQWRILVFNRNIMGKDIDSKGREEQFDDYNSPY